MRIVLASQSPYRQAQLKDFGLPFEAHAPKIDEESLKRTGPSDLTELTRYLAVQKAQSLAADFPDAVIIGSDQVAECEGARLDKPGGHTKALAQLTRLAGRAHRLITSVAVVRGPDTLLETEVTTLHMRALPKEFLSAYLERDRPYDCAGSYKIEKAGLALVAKVEGSDPSAIQGLPLIRLTALLERLGVRPELLWRTK